MSDGRGRTVVAVDVRERLVELPPYSFWIREAGTGTPIILIHGLGGSSAWWLHNFDALAREHHVCAIDLIGFSRNRFFLRPSRLPLRFEDIAALLGRWIIEEFGEPAHVVGNSMGGQIAIHLAASRPDAVRSLVLVNSTGIPFRVAPSEHLRNLFLPRGLWSFLLILIRDAFRAGPMSIAVAFGRLLRDDARPLMRQLTVPVLLVWGEHDPLVPLRYGKEMLAEIPNAQLEVIERAAHIPMWEQPETFNAIVLRFIDEMDSVRAGRPANVFSWPISGWTDGIAYRQAGRIPDVVLIHGLGMSSAYFVRIAEALFNRGCSPIAPDLPGFGESNDAPAAGPEEHARVLAEWASRQQIQHAIWVGHSAGCNVVRHLAETRPDLVSSAVYVGPLWRRRSPWLLFGALVADAFREPIALFSFIVRAYWRVGLGRWVATFNRYAADFRQDVPSGPMIAGARDPLVDRSTITDPISVPGAHACLFSHPRETADAIMPFRSSSRTAS